MTKLKEKIVGLLKVAPYYLMFLSAASIYSVYSNQYPEYEWWRIYASVAAFLTAISALGIWYQQKWSIVTVIIFVTVTTFIQVQLNQSNYFIVIVFALIVWAQTEEFLLKVENERNQPL